MTKATVLFEILEYGKKEQKRLEEQGKMRAAFEFETARKTLLYGLIESVKEVKRRLYYMTHYHEEHLALYVHDDYARLELVELRKKLFKE